MYVVVPLESRESFLSASTTFMGYSKPAALGGDVSTYSLPSVMQTYLMMPSMHAEMNGLDKTNPTRDDQQ